jgi:LPS sulfotransferase NodH
MPHFYDRPDAHKTAILAEANRLRTQQERNRFLHDHGVIYNKPRIVPDEVETCIAASAAWNDYLAASGIELIVVSSQSLVAPAIRRGRLEEVLAK